MGDLTESWTQPNETTLKEPFVWFLDMIANPPAVAIIAKECVEKFGDLKKAEATVGAGPWMLDSYRPNLGMTMVRHPNYFVSGLPHIDRVELGVDEDNASRMAAFLAGKYDIGWEFIGIINRVDWVSIKDQLKQKRPKLQTGDFTSPVMTHISMRTDKAPFNDVRVRRAMSMAIAMAFGPQTGFLEPDNHLYASTTRASSRIRATSTIPSSPTC
jgi:peptide/nickel transport system substrate-binding protein